MNIIKSLTKEVFSNKSINTVKNGTKIVKGLLASGGRTDEGIDITRPDKNIIFEKDFSEKSLNEEKTEVFVPEARLSDEIYELTRRVNALTKELEEQKEKNAQLTNETEVLQEKIREYFGLINGLSGNVSALENETKKHSAQLGAINEKIRLMNKRIPSKAVTWIAFGLAILGVAACTVLFFK